MKNVKIKKNVLFNKIKNVILRLNRCKNTQNETNFKKTSKPKPN